MAFRDQEEEDLLRIPGATEDDYDAPEPATTRRPPSFPSLGTDPGSNLVKIARYGQATEQFNISQSVLQGRREELARKRAHNAAARKTQAETGAQFIADEAGYEQPVIDPYTGHQRYTTRETEVQYDAKGRPYQVKITKTGQPVVEDPDKDAQYGENPDDPNDPFIYRKTKATPWEPIDPEEGIHSPIPKLAAVSAKALHARELDRLSSEQADINLRLRDPLRPRQLTEQKRLELETMREGLSQPIPKPAPKPAFFGMGVNQQATADASAQWVKEEQDRVAMLADTDKALASDKERATLEQQAYDLALRHKAVKDVGPAGILKDRRAQAAQKIAALPEEEAKIEVESRAKNLEIGDQAITAKGQELKSRSDALQGEISQGVTADRAREIEVERMSLERDAEQINAEIASRNALAAETTAGVEARNLKERERIKAQRDEMRQTPEFVPIADQLDIIDTDNEKRAAEAQKITDPAAQRAAIDTINQESKAKVEALIQEKAPPSIKHEGIIRQLADIDTESFKQGRAESNIEKYKALRQTAVEKRSALLEGVPFEEREAVEKSVSTQRALDALSAGKEKLGLMDKLSDVVKNPSQLVPFVASVPEIAGLLNVREAAQRVEAGTGDGDDYQVLAEFAAKSGQEKSLLYNVTNIISALPAFAGELAVTGGLFSAGRAAAVKGGSALLKRLVSKEAGAWLAKTAAEKLGEQGVKSMVGQLAVKSAVGMAGAAAQVPLAAFLRGAVEYTERTMPKVKEITKDKGEIKFLFDPAEGPVSASLSAAGNQYVEVFSERAGGAFDIVGKIVGKALPPALRDQISKAFLFGRWMGKNKGKTAAAFQKFLKEAQWNGVANEVLEERVGDAFRGFADFVQRVSQGEGFARAAAEAAKGAIPSGEQWLTELLAFSVPGAAISGVQAITRPKIKAPEPEGPAIKPEHIAAANIQIDEWQPPAQLTPEGAQLERMAAQGAMKVIAGQPIDTLLAEERSALESKLPNGAARMEEVGGTQIITEGQLTRLKMIAPDTATMPIRGEAELREELTAKGEEPEKPAEPAAPKPKAPTFAPGEPPVKLGVIRPLSIPERTRAEALEKVLKSAGADEVAARVFSKHFVMQEGAASDFAGQRERIRTAFEAAGGKENAPDIMAAILTQTKLHKKTREETFSEAVRQLEAEGKTLSERETKVLRSVMPHLAPAIDSWREIFSRISFMPHKMESGGVATFGEGSLNILLGDLVNADNLEAIARNPSRAKLLVSEEAKHVVGRAVLAKIAKEKGIEGESDDKIADNYVAQIWKQLPADLQKSVRGIYGETGTGIRSDVHAGHEFFRMLAQHDTAIKDGKLIYKGKVLTEQTIGENVVRAIRDYLRNLFSYFSDLARRLKEDGAPDELVSQVEDARASIRDRIKEIQSLVVERQQAAYVKEYADKEARSVLERKAIRRVLEEELGGPAEARPGVGDVGRGGREAVRGKTPTVPPSGGEREVRVGGVGNLPGDRTPAEAAKTPEELRLAELEAEKAEREAAEERAKERRNLAVQKRAERAAGRDAILAKVPEDAKEQAAAVLDKMQHGAPTYVLAANRERIPASYVSVAPETVQTSHVGADFHKNPLYGGENVRPYHSDETEQNKVRKMAQPGALDEDAATSDVKSASEGSPQIVLAIFNDAAGNLQVQAQTAGGNGREQGINLAPLEDQERLSEAWVGRGQSDNFGLTNMPEGWRGYRFVGVYDLRDEAQNREYLQLVDKLNPSPGVVQDTAARADIDAALKIPVEAISDIPLSLSPNQAVAELTVLIRDAEKLGLDRNLMSGLVNNPGQAQFYIQRLLLAAAFRSKAIGDFFTSAQWASGHATVSGLIKAATSTALKLREKGQGNIADAIGRTIERVAEYVKKGDNIARAIKRAADQTEMGDDGPVINAIADALVRKVEFLPLNKRGLRPVDSEETIAGFESFMRDMATAIDHFSEEPDLLGETDTIANTIQRAISAHARKAPLPSAKATAAKPTLENMVEIRAINRQTKGITQVKVPATKELVRALSVHETIYRSLIKCLDS